VTFTPANAKPKKFFSRRLAESVEGLNSSLALAAGDLWPKKGVKGLRDIPEAQKSLNGSSAIFSQG